MIVAPSCSCATGCSRRRGPSTRRSSTSSAPPSPPPAWASSSSASSRAARGAGRSRATRPTINGHEITPFGFSLVPFLILGGVLLLWCFAHLGGAARAAGPGRAAGPRAAADRAAARRPVDADVAAARAAGHLLRAARLPAGRPRASTRSRPASGCSRCRSTMLIAALAGPEARGPLRAEARRADRPARDRRSRRSCWSARSTSSSTSRASSSRSRCSASAPAC